MQASISRQHALKKQKRGQARFSVLENGIKEIFRDLMHWKREQVQVSGEGEKPSATFGSR
jgi:hypothetical protein